VRTDASHCCNSSLLVGPVAKIKDELQQWEASVLTSLLIQGDPSQLPMIADALS